MIKYISCIILMLASYAGIAQMPASLTIIPSSLMEDYSFTSNGMANVKTYKVDALFSFDPNKSEVILQAKDSFGKIHNSVFTFDREKTRELLQEASDYNELSSLRIIVTHSKATGQEYVFLVDEMDGIVSVQTCYDDYIGRYTSEHIYMH